MQSIMYLPTSQHNLPTKIKRKKKNFGGLGAGIVFFRVLLCRGPLIFTKDVPKQEDPLDFFLGLWTNSPPILKQLNFRTDIFLRTLWF